MFWQKRKKKAKLHSPKIKRDQVEVKCDSTSRLQSPKPNSLTGSEGRI